MNSVSGKTFPTFNPATEEEIARVQEAQSEDVDKAVSAARKAFEIDSDWRKTDPSERGSLIHKLAQLLRRDKDYIGVLNQPYILTLNPLFFFIS